MTVETTTGKRYWLHLGRHEGPGVSITYTMGRTDEPETDISAGASPTLHYTSWETLQAALQQIHTPELAVKQAYKELVESGSYILQIYLTDNQLVELKFPDKI